MQSMAASSRPHVVVVGAGFGGLRVVKALCRSNVQITLIDKSNHHLFQPLLYQVATAGLSPADIASPIRSILRDQENVTVLMETVTGVDPKQNQIFLNTQTLPFDYLVIATGARHSYFNHPEWEAFAPGLKSIADATSLRQKILTAFEMAEKESDLEKRKALLHFILVGAGPTGVEMAGAIAELSHRALARDFRHIDPKSAKISLIEAGPRVLGTFPERLSQNAVQALESIGVEVLVNTRVEKIDEAGVTANGNRLSATTVIWTAGVKASPAGEWLHAEMDSAGRVIVTTDCSLSDSPHIFVIGDTAHFKDEAGKPLPGIAPVAMQQGTFVGKKIAALVEGKKPTAPFRYLDKGNLATIGRSRAVAHMGNFYLTGILAWLAWTVVHIYYLIGFRNRLLVFIQWIWAFLTFQRGARLIVARLMLLLSLSLFSCSHAVTTAENKETLSGTFISGMMAIGGETTGMAIKTATGETVEVKVDDKALVKGLRNQKVTAQGHWETIGGVERKNRRIFVIESIQ